jgi:prepilin-type N-terminal cleavage/methylation domain-containing protein
MRPDCRGFIKTTVRFLFLENGQGGVRLNSLQSKKGFTLIEVLITLVILAVSLLAIAGLMVTTVVNNSYGAHMTEAVTYAQDLLEELRAMRWENILEGTSSDQPAGSTGVVYARTWTTATNGNTKTITVTINWSDKTNHSVTIRSMITQ